MRSEHMVDYCIWGFMQNRLLNDRIGDAKQDSVRRKDCCDRKTTDAAERDCQHKYEAVLERLKYWSVK